jgi:hypothetical protein
MDQHSELLTTGLIEQYTPPKSMSELGLDENMENFGILLNGKKIDLDTIVEPYDKFVIIAHVRGG